MAFPPIDLVFTYVDGADPRHAAKREALRLASGAPGAALQPAIWFNGVGEIRFAVRSVLQAMPWVRTIHVVSDGQPPPVDAALTASGRVRIVDHGAIIPPEYRPAFASTIIESFLHRVPGLSEIYLYDNDDFLHGAATGPDEFVRPRADGGVALRLRTVPAIVRAAIRAAADRSPRIVPRANPYTAGIANAAALLRARLGLPWRDIVFPRHLTQVYRRSTAVEVEAAFAPELDAARRRHLRTREQISWSTLAYSLECHRHGAEQRRWRPIGAHRGDELFLDFGRYSAPRRMAAAWREAAETRAKFICLNNIPASERPAFERAMAARGLGGEAGAP